MGSVKVGFSENLVVNISVRKIVLEEKYCKSMIFYSLRKHPFLLALRRWGRFAKRPQRRRARRNGCFRRLDLLNINIFQENNLFHPEMILL